MYKSGKNWVIAPIVFLGLTAGLGQQANVKADNVSSASKTDSETAQQTKSNSLNGQNSIALKSSASSTSVNTAKIETTNFAVQSVSNKSKFKWWQIKSVKGASDDCANNW